MRNVLIGLFFLSGIIFVWTVMLMSPKWGLWMGMWGIASSGEYGSKKSLEGSLKKIATVSGLVFVVVSIVLPYTS